MSPRALSSIAALTAALLAAPAALAQADGPRLDTRSMGATGSATTRQEVRREAMESLQRQHHAVTTAGENVGGSLYEIQPGLAAAMTGGRSRAEVAAELREAQRSGALKPPSYWGND